MYEIQGPWEKLGSSRTVRRIFAILPPSPTGIVSLKDDAFRGVLPRGGERTGRGGVVSQRFGGEERREESRRLLDIRPI